MCIIYMYKQRIIYPTRYQITSEPKGLCQWSKTWVIINKRYIWVYINNGDERKIILNIIGAVIFICLSTLLSFNHRHTIQVNVRVCVCVWHVEDLFSRQSILFLIFLFAYTSVFLDIGVTVRAV